MVSRSYAWAAAGWLCLCLAAGSPLRADEPKPTAENTIHIHLEQPVTPQKFTGSPKFFIRDVTDRSGNAQPMLVLKPRGGIFLDQQPTAIAREAIEQSLKSANLLASDAASADLILRIYLFHFGLANGSGTDFFGKVEFAVVVKNPKTDESQEIRAAGTSIADIAVRKKNIQKNVQANIEGALQDAVRNLLRGAQLRDAVTALWKPASNEGAPAAAPSADLSFLLPKRFERPILSRRFSF